MCGRDVEILDTALAGTVSCDVEILSVGSGGQSFKLCWSSNFVDLSGDKVRNSSSVDKEKSTAVDCSAKLCGSGATDMVTCEPCLRRYDNCYVKV